jgi:hypothetical protein
LKELELSTGNEDTVVTFDSNDLHPGDVVSDWQVKTVSACRSFNQAAAYFLEATFTSGAQVFAPQVRLEGMVATPTAVSIFECPES